MFDQVTEASVIGLAIFTIRFAVLLYLAALGELIAERSGVLNLGVEGMMAMGAAGGYIVGVETGNPWLALAVAIVVGALTAALHGLLTVIVGADQVVSGLALTLFGLAMASFMARSYVGAPPRARFDPIAVPGLSDLPWVGEILFEHSLPVYFTVLVGFVTWFVLQRTRLGLGLRAAGESAASADAVGHSVAGLRFGAVMVGGAFAGAAGGYLSLSLAPGWSDGMTAGRGWIAVALVIFGAWRPGRIALGALLFGATLALEPRLQTFGVDISPILLSMSPYVLTLVALVILSVRSRHRPSPAPAAIGIPFRREER